MLKNITYTLIFGFSLLFMSCSDDPGSIGASMNENNSIKVDYLNSLNDTVFQSSSSYSRVLALGSANKLILGKQGNLESSVLIKFSIGLEDKIKNDLDSIEIISARIILTNSYSFGNSSANFDFSVHKVTYDWAYSTFNIDSINLLTYENTNLSSNKSFADTLMSFDIDNGLIKDWMKDEKANSSANTYGIYLKPSDNSGKFYGFWGYSASIDLALQPKLTVVLKKGTSYQDTITFYTSQDNHLVKGNASLVPSGYLQLQSGVSVNSNIYFDLSKLPNGAIINSAYLMLNMDTLYTELGKGYTEGLYAYFTSDSSAHKYESPALLERNGTKFSGDISSIINRILISKSNLGVTLSTRTPIEGLEKYAIFGSSAADTLKPRLSITYSYRN